MQSKQLSEEYSLRMATQQESPDDLIAGAFLLKIERHALLFGLELKK
ncbi:MAG: hypothetical protein ACI8YQ_004051 [Polaribacter sp.]|jgi:hypothetical protein